MSLMLRKWILNSIIQDRPARKPIAHLSRIESLPGDSQIHGNFKLACISDKEKFIRAVFTKDSLALFEQEGTELDDIRGGLISLQDYAFISSVGIDRRFSEYFVEIHKFHFIGGERNMPIPTVTNINLDERVQSKLAQVWREERMDNRIHGYQHNTLRVYSQTEDAPQLSQDELSMLLVAMSDQSQVDSIEAISSSQIFELENIPGWLKPEKDLQMEEQVFTQETVYDTPLAGSPVMIVNRSSCEETPVSDGIFETPPEGLTSPMVTDNGLDHQQGKEAQPMIDSEEPLIPSHHGAAESSLKVIGGAKEINEILEQAVQNVSRILEQSNPTADETLSDIFSDDEETSTVESPVHDEDEDDFSHYYEISDSQITDLNEVWVSEQHSLHATSTTATKEQPCSSDSLFASATPNNSYNYHDNHIINNGCTEHRATATSSGQPEGDQLRVRQQQQGAEQPISKGKGGTTKNIHQVEKLYSIRSEYDDMLDDDISISSSQKDELDTQWVAANSELNSSLETFEDLHPFQLTSLPEPSKNRATGDAAQQPLTETLEDEPGPSGMVTMDTGSGFVLNQEARGRGFVNVDDVDLNASDLDLLSQAETVTSPTQTKTIQTSLASTGAITRLLDVNNELCTMNGAAIGDKTIPQSSAASGNTRQTPSRTMTSTHNSAQLENSRSKLNPNDSLVPHKKSTITLSGSHYSNDTEASKERLDSNLTYRFKPLHSEEDIDEFIDSYWTLQRLRTFSVRLFTN